MVLGVGVGDGDALAAKVLVATGDGLRVVLATLVGDGAAVVVLVGCTVRDGDTPEVGDVPAACVIDGVLVGAPEAVGVRA